MEGISFPIGVESTTFADSSGSFGLQVADIIAGMIYRWCRWITNGRPATDPYATSLDSLLSSMPEPLFTWQMWPTQEIARTPTAPELGDPLEYLIQRIRESDAINWGTDRTGAS